MLEVDWYPAHLAHLFVEHADGLPAALRKDLATAEAEGAATGFKHFWRMDKVRYSWSSALRKA